MGESVRDGGDFLKKKVAMTHALCVMDGAFAREVGGVDGGGIGRRAAWFSGVNKGARGVAAGSGLVMLEMRDQAGAAAAEKGDGC